MPSAERNKTTYPGVYYIMGTGVATGKPERIYYIRYRRDGKMTEEKAGRQFQDDMTPARAARVRAQRIEGRQLSNREQREAIEAQKRAEAARWTIDRLWQEYKAQRPDLKGIVTDENRFQNHVKPRFGDKEPKELIQFDVDRLRIQLLKTRKPQTVKHVLALLKRIINFGVKKDLCQGLSFIIEMPKVHNLVTEGLTPEQLSRLLEAIDEDSDTQSGNIMKMAVFVGMRRGEMFKLRWSDVDFERNFITVRDPKGGPDQKIPLNKAAREVLENQPRIDSPFVFPGRGGRQKTTSNRRFLDRIRDRVGLPKDFRPLHGLRHSYASMLISSGQVDIYTLQRLLTHKTPQMTSRYAHLKDDVLRRAADVAESLIEQATKGKKEEKVIHIESKKE